MAKGSQCFLETKLSRGFDETHAKDETNRPLYDAPSVSAWVQRLSVFPRSRRGSHKKAKPRGPVNAAHPRGFRKLSVMEKLRHPSAFVNSLRGKISIKALSALATKGGAV
jgi:hypothetical protein